MAAYVVVQGTIKDQEKMLEYRAAAGPTVSKHSGKILCRGPSEVLSGDNPHKLMVVLEFPSKEAARAWYNSAEYQAIVSTREAGLESTFTLAGED